MNNETEKCYCKKCQQYTNHYLLHDENESITNNDGTTIWKCYETIRCLGCDTASFHYSECHTETSSPESRLLLANSQYFPKERFFRSPIKDVQKLPIDTRNIYFEILTSLNENLYILTAIGLRILIESVCREKSYNWKNLYKGIEELSINGILSFTQVEFLHVCRFLGNIAAHEIASPSREQLISALDIIEILLVAIYILPDKANLINIKRSKTMDTTIKE